MTGGRKRGAPSAEAPTRVSRGPNRRRTDVYVAIEGEATERDYLTSLNKRYGDTHHFVIHVLWQRNGLTTAEEVVAKAAGGREAGSPAWALFDMDDKTDLQAAVRLAGAEDVGVGLSNPAFEVWLSLHFGDVSAPFGDRVRLVRRLRQAHPAYAQYARDGTGRRLSGPRLAALLQDGRLGAAAGRARRLDRRCEDGDCDHPVAGRACPLERRDPSTGVYRLLEELGITSGVGGP